MAAVCRGWLSYGGLRKMLTLCAWVTRAVHANAPKAEMLLPEPRRPDTGLLLVVLLPVV